jgi:hypothetical protein
MALFSFLKNPAIKTVVAQVSGAVGGILLNSVDVAVQHPTGGTAAYLQAHPAGFVGWLFVANFVHNVISEAFPPSAPIPAVQQVSAPASPNS